MKRDSGCEQRRLLEETTRLWWTGFWSASEGAASAPGQRHLDPGAESIRRYAQLVLVVGDVVKTCVAGELDRTFPSRNAECDPIGLLDGADQKHRRDLVSIGVRGRIRIVDLAFALPLKSELRRQQ